MQLLSASSCHPGLRLLVIVARKCAKQSLFYKKFLDNLFAIPHLHSPITNSVALSNRPSSFRISPWFPKSSLSLSLKLSNLHSATFTKDDFQHQIQIGVQARQIFFLAMSLSPCLTALASLFAVCLFLPNEFVYFFFNLPKINLT